MGRDLLPDLFGGEVDHDELHSLLLSHFHQAQQEPDGSILMRSPEDEQLRIYSSGESIDSIVQGSAFEPATLLQLQATIREQLLDNQEAGVAVQIEFSVSPIEGSFRAPVDAFQILPAPPNAPQPPVLMAERPFLLEVPIVRSGDGLVTLGRRAREATRWAWFLNAVLRERITSLGYRSRQAWVICPDNEHPGAIPAPVWGQEYYDVPGLVAYRDTLTEGVPAIPLMREDDYYSAIAFTVGHPMSLPDSLPRSVERYLHLGADDRSKFERAAQWLFAANDLWASHMSSYYVALVAAVEALAYEKLPADPCPTCGRDRSQRPTAAFRDFLIAYAPGSRSRADIDALYSIRSGLVHGTALLNHDSPFGGFHFKTSTLNQDHHVRSLSALMATLVVNWLDAQSALR